MSDNQTESHGENNPQPETNVAENVAPVELPPVKMEAVNIGEEINKNTEAPSMEPMPETIPPPDETATVASAEEIFDPNIHAMKNGVPVKTADGRFAKKRGRKSGSKNSPEAQTEIPQAEPVTATISGRDFNSPASITAVQMVSFVLDTATMLAVKNIGPEWQPSPEERALLQDVHSRYVTYKGWDNAISPEMMVVGITAAFLMPRIMHPNFKKRFSKAPQNAQSNNRQNPNGQNNVSESPSETVSESKSPRDNFGPNFIDRLG